MSAYKTMHTKILRQQSGDPNIVFDKTKYISVMSVHLVDLVPGEDEKSLYTRITLKTLTEYKLEDTDGIILPEPFLSLFKKRLRRQKELSLFPPTEEEESPTHILSLFDRFIIDKTSLSERELLLLQTYLEIDNSVLNPFVSDRNGATQCMTNMSLNSYLIRPSSISDSNRALVRVISVKKSNEVLHFLTSAIAGLGYVWFSCDVDEFRTNGMVTENDPRAITILACFASFIEMISYLATRFSFDLTLCIRHIEKNEYK